MFALAGFLLGLVLGSFVKVLADRSLNGKSFWGRSFCLTCKKNLRFYDLFPIFSYLFTLGKCRYCKKKISWEYPLVEIVIGILVGYLFFQTFKNFQFSIFNFQFLNLVLNFIYKLFFICILAALFITDLKKMFIPDRIIIPAIKIGFGLSLFVTFYKVSYFYFFLKNTTLGKYLLPPNSDYFLRHALYSAIPFLTGVLMAILIGGFFYFLIFITKGKGMGGGDVKLGAFIGLMLGFPQALIVLILSFLTGAIFSIILIILRKKHFGQTIPFGPFLVTGSLLTLFWGDQILNWYLRMSLVHN